LAGSQIRRDNPALRAAARLLGLSI